MANGVATGPACGNLVPTALVGGEWDGFTGSWGFADTYEYEYNGSAVTFTDVILYYSTYAGYEGWLPLFYNYGTYVQVTGDASSASFIGRYQYSTYYP